MKLDDHLTEVGISETVKDLKQRVIELEQQRASWDESERALRNSETLLRQIAANYPNSYMSIINKDLTVGFTSGQEFKKQNLDPESFIGRTLEEVFGEQASFVRKHYLRTFTGEETIFELHINNQDQLYKTVPLPNETGEIEHILSVVENITERKQAETQVAQVAQEWAETFDAIADGIFLMDTENIILRCNRALTDMLETTSDQILGRHCWEVMHGTTEPVQACPLFQTICTGSRGEGTLLIKDRWINVHLDPMLDTSGNLIGYVHVLIDVTEEKQAEFVLEKRTSELSERVRELNCLFGISALIEKTELSVDEILQGTVDLIPPAWQYPEITCARIVFGDRAFVSDNFKETQYQLSREIIVRGEKLGTVEVNYLEEKPECDEGPFLKGERSLLNAIAERLGRDIERIQAEDELIKLAVTDPLTGLLNRRHFFELTEKEIVRSQRYGHPLSCIMFDVDTFKDINDTHGHIFGDQVLQEVAKLCQDTIRQVDFLARFGGDEFVILLPETASKKGKQVAERLRSAIEKKTIVIDEQPIHLTFSLGLVSVDKGDELELTTLLKQADQALYLAKERGKNQVSIWQEK